MNSIVGGRGRMQSSATVASITVLLYLVLERGIDRAMG